MPAITVLVAVVLLFLSPLAAIWAWNELFWTVVVIPYTINTWLAMLILMSALGKTKIIKK